ncbi:MAG: hypothetical protein E6G16_06810 [Actinobacteria bacterium]|nr:MAG: hypothetical protein E6G16_06810 [Actinomycetota bacterium]
MTQVQSADASWVALPLGPVKVTSTLPAAASAAAAAAESGCPEASVRVNLTVIFEPALSTAFGSGAWKPPNAATAFTTSVAAGAAL